MNMVKGEPANETGRRPWRRKSRNFFLKGRMQSRFVLGFVCVIVGGFVLYLLLSYYFIDRHLAEELYRTHLKKRTALGAAGPVLWWLAGASISAASLVLAIFGYSMTHRVETRLHGFVGAVSRLGRCDFICRIDLNKAFNGLCKSFNMAAASIDKRFASIKRSCVALEDAAAQLGDATGGQLHRDAARTALGRIADERVRVMKEIKRFKV